MKEISSKKLKSILKISSRKMGCTNLISKILIELMKREMFKK